MLKNVDESLWVNDVSFKVFGFDFGNRMTCIQLTDGSLWLHSPTKYEQTTYDSLQDIGSIKYLITPSHMHNLFVMDWKKSAKDAQLLAPAKASKLEADIKLEEMTSAALDSIFNNEIICIPINGIPFLNEFAFFHHKSKTLILTDLAFNFGDNVSGWKKLFLKLYGAYNKFGPTITVRTLISDKIAFRESLRTIMELDFERIIVSHGNIVDSDGKSLFIKAFKKYL